MNVGYVVFRLEQKWRGSLEMLIALFRMLNDMLHTLTVLDFPLPLIISNRINEHLQFPC